MKNISKRFGFIAIFAVIGLSFAVPSVQAGGIMDRVFNGGAKSLAKQTMDLTKKAADIEKRAAELQVKAADIEKKTAALSDRNRRTFREELARLNIEGPGWLFNDAPGLLANAFDDSADDDNNAAGGGFLGGLVRMVRSFSGGGNNKSGAVSDGSLSSGFSSGSSSGGKTAPSSDILGGKTGAFFSIFDGKNYHMKTKTILEGMELPREGTMEVISEIFVKGDMMATVSETMGMTTRMIYRNNMAHVVNDEMRTVMVMPIPASSGNPSEEPVRTSGMIMTGSGTARFNGKNLPYEEYSLSTEEGSIKTQWFLDGNNLAGIRTIAREMTIDMVILALDQNVPNSVFEIPAGYQRMELPQMPGGY